jgi:outer membrane protein TolC
MKIDERRVLRRIQGRAVTVAAALGFATSALAAQTEPTRLADLYARVARSNPKIAAAQALVRASRARVPGAMRPPEPELQLGIMNRSLPGLGPMQPLGMTQLQLMQMVPLGGKLRLAGRVAGARADATSARAEDVLWELRAQAAMAFYDLYAVDRQREVARETLRLLQDIARAAEAMYRVGEGRQADVLRADLEVARMAEDTLRMQAMRETTTARLEALIGPSGGEQPISVVRPQFPDTLPVRAWVDSVAVENRPMIRAGLHEVQAADASATLAKKEIIPDLQVGVQFGRGSSTMTDATGMTSTTAANMGSLMVGASIPVFARDRQYQMRNEADAMKAMAIADVSAMRAETRGKIGEAFAELNRARHLARLYRTTVIPHAEATVASALSSYRVGKVDFMTLLDAQMTANKYREELFALEADEGKAWAELEMLTAHELIDSSSIASPTDANGGVGRPKGGAK